jgi:hypothetical protein
MGQEHNINSHQRRSPAQVYVEGMGHFPSSHPQELLDTAHEYYTEIGQDNKSARKSAAKFVTKYSKNSGHKTSQYINKWNIFTGDLD